MVQKNNEKFLIKNSLNLIDRGWIESINIDTNEKIFICENTLLSEISVKESLFKIKSGIHSGNSIFLKKNAFGEIAISKKVQKFFPANITLEKEYLLFKKNKLRIAGKLNINAGKYKIAYPDRPRFNVNARYYEEKNGSKFYSTWFPIFDEKNIFTTYLHLGSYSNGCITVDFDYTKNNLASWSDIYIYLINSAKNKNYLGNLEII